MTAPITRSGKGSALTWAEVDANFTNLTADVVAAQAAAQAASAPIAHVGSSGSAHGVVTTTAAGFMSAPDKTKLDAITGTNTGDQTSVSGSSGSCTGNAVTATTASECTGNSATATNASNLNGTAGLCGYSTALASIAYVGAGGPQVMGSTTNAAMLSFHRAGAYAVNFGLDTDNVLKVGGWSMGAVAYPIYHAGNPIALAPPAGTATVAPIKLAAGTNLTAPVAGALEYDGVNAYFTQDTTQGRGAIPITQQFVVNTNQAAFGPTVGNFFGATSAISLNGSSAYCIDCFCYFTKTTAGTLTFAPTVSSAASLIHSTYEATPILGFSGTLQTGASLTGLNASVNTAIAATHLATGSLSTAVQYVFRFKIYIITALGCNFRLNVTQSAGTLTVLAGSHYKVTRIGNSAGNFVA